MEKKVSALIFKTNGEMVDVEYNDPIKLEEMQQAVGGYIEPIYLPEGKVMLVNEDGKWTGLEPNLNATAYLKSSMDYFNDVIVGDALLLDKQQHEEELNDTRPSQLIRMSETNRYNKTFKQQEQ